MIHFFEGFNWPQPAGQVIDSNSISEFNFGATAAFTKSGGSLFLALSAAVRAWTPSKRAVPLGDRLVIGSYLYFGLGSSSNSSYEYSSVCFSPQHAVNGRTTPGNDAGWSSPMTLTSAALPVLQVNAYASSARFPGLSLRNTVNSSGALWTEALPGVNFKTLHYYEVVYDVLNSKIEIWLDNLLVGTVAYTFTALQKSALFYINLEAVSYYYNGTLQSYGICNGVYVATERLGPVKFGARLPQVDAEVSPSFKTAPYFNKVNTRSDGTGAKITTTLSKQMALFSSPAVITGDVLALNFGGRFSSLEQSALESLGAAKLTLKSNGQLYQSDLVSIPKQSFVKTTKYLEKNPITSQPWTADEINTLLFGAEIVVDPKIVT